MKYHEEGRLTFDKEVVYFNKEVALKPELDLIENGEYSYDYFVDEKEKIRLAEIRPITYKDEITEILKKNIGYDPSEGIPLMDINCDSLEFVIQGLIDLQPDEIKMIVSLDSIQLDTLDYGDY